jgi:hypothetical protein
MAALHPPLLAWQSSAAPERAQDQGAIALPATDPHGLTLQRLQEIGTDVGIARDRDALPPRDRAHPPARIPAPVHPRHDQLALRRARRLCEVEAHLLPRAQHARARALHWYRHVLRRLRIAGQGSWGEP